MKWTLTWTSVFRRSSKVPHFWMTPNPLSEIHHLGAFNSDTIVYDNTPWIPGRDVEPVDKSGVEDERKPKNVATRIMSNGVEVLVRDKSGDGKLEQTKYMEVKTIQPSAPTKINASNYPKINKRIDSPEDGNSFELIQPSEGSHISCSGYSCSHTKTESLKTKYTIDASNTKYGVLSTKVKLELQQTKNSDKKTQYGPYKFESSTHIAPIDKMVEKYTEVMNDYSEEKESNSVEESELLTNEQAPNAAKITNKIDKVEEKKPNKLQKINKSKFAVADLLKLGTLGIKGLTQLAPVIEKMTGCFTKKQEQAAKLAQTTIKPAENLIPYSSNKRIDNILESKQGTFPIYIPVDELETSESQTIFTNATLHQNLAWAAEHKLQKSQLNPHKIIHESPLVNGGIPISPGEIITANSDVIVGKPAVGGPLTLAASGIKLHNPVNPPPLDSFVAANEQYSINERPLSEQPYSSDVKVDDSYDLRPPGLPKPIPNKPINVPRPVMNNDNYSKYPYRMPNAPNTDEPKIPGKNTNHGPPNYHGRPVFLDYIPSMASFNKNNVPNKYQPNLKPSKDNKKEVEVSDNSPSSSEIVQTHIRTDEEYTITGDPNSSQPFLVDIQPSRVANVLIPHGSSTALVFAGSSEPHKTGDYVDDPLPYPEPGYFGSFSIDAPQMTNVHNVAPNNKPFSNKPYIKSPLESNKHISASFNNDQENYRNDQKLKWKDNQLSSEYSKIPPPTSNQETHVQIGPHITQYNPDIYSPSNGDFEKHSQVKNNEKNEGKDVIDKEYENYLAVPPPPPKMHFNQENKNKPYNQRPIVQSKPVQDMSVFLNIQHPVPKEHIPPKVTSEIYFAAQAPSNTQAPTYTIRMPPQFPTYSVNKQKHNVQPPKPIKTGTGHIQNIYSTPTSQTHNNKSIVTQGNNQDSTYTVTLNTATNVANNVNNLGQIIGSSVPVAIGKNQMNTDIPIGTNFAIRVEDNTMPVETYNLQGEKSHQINYDNHGAVPSDVSVGDNRWNKSSIETNENTIIGHAYQDKPVYINEVKPPAHIYENTYHGPSYSSEPAQNNAERPVTFNKNTVIGTNYNVPFGQGKPAGFSIENNKNTLIGLNYGERPAQPEYTPRPFPNLSNSASTRPGLTYGEISATENEKRPSIEQSNHNIELNYGEISVPEFSSKPQKYYDIANSEYNYNERPAQIDLVKPSVLSNTYISSTLRPTPPSLTNSHANFPMINDDNIASHSGDDAKPVTEKINDTKRPGKLIPNLPTNSHGWYSSVVSAENKVKNIKTESTTRKVIPLLNNIGGKENLPAFGQKITSAGKPPTEFWVQNKPQIISSFNIGRPFGRPVATEKTTSKPFTVKPYKPNYIPNLGAINQPVYDIPIRDNSDETTTHRIPKPSLEQTKPVYENSEEIYDGEDELENTGEIDGEVSSESMKIPVVSSSNEVLRPPKISNELTLLHDRQQSSPSNRTPQAETQPPIIFDSQTEKPFGSFNKSNSFQSNAMKPIYDSNVFMKPRPFTMPTNTILDHQLQQPHWQINQLQENATNNVSYEDNMELNIGEEMNAPSYTKQLPTQKPVVVYNKESGSMYSNPPRQIYKSHSNNSYSGDSNIITSTVHINDKKPLIVEKLPEKTTLSELEINRTSSEIIDLSPPPPSIQYNFNPSTTGEIIMGMSPPLLHSSSGMRQPSKNPTPRPSFPIRTPLPHVNKPPRTLPPRLPQRPTRKPLSRDEVSTYRPAYEILNNIRRPAYNQDQPSSQLLPPPRDFMSRPTLPATTVSAPAASNIVFPTPISSGWLTSSGVEFSSSFNFGPTSLQYPVTPKPSKVPESSEIPNDDSYSYESEYTSEHVGHVGSEKPLNEDRVSSSKESSTESGIKISFSSTEKDVNDSYADETSQEQFATDKIKISPSDKMKNRTRKPYPFRNDDKKSSTSKFKQTPKLTATLRPTRTMTRPDILYPTRQTSIRKIVRPIATRLPPIITTSVIESSESSIDDEFIKPTEVFKNKIIPTVSQYDKTTSTQMGSADIATPTLDDMNSLRQATHHAGNEVKISDQFIPTKTEFKTTVITHTKTLSEPPVIISSVGYVNLTHTLTVTHTETSLISQSEGAVTQTFVMTNTHTSTIVDVITEIHTQVQPTTIIETVTKHIPIPQLHPTPVQNIPQNTVVALDDITMSSEEDENLIIRDDTTENVQKIDADGDDGDNDTFFVVMNKSQNGGHAPTINNELDTGDYEVTRNEQVNNNGVSQVLFGEILLAGTPYLETTNVHSTGYGKECQPDCKASRNERCQRIDSVMKCVCRPGFARMFPDRPCKPTYTYSVKLALGSQGNDRLHFQDSLADNSSKQYQALAFATHEGINRMVMQSDLRDVYHGVHITGFRSVEMKDPNGGKYHGVMNDFYVQLSDNAHESRLKEVIEKYLRNNNYSLGGTDVHAAGEMVERLDVSDFDECTSRQFHDCSEHAQCFNLRGTYTCSCLEGFADLSVNNLYPGRICSAEPVGCERCNYHGSCYSRDDQRVLCECFQWYAGPSCQVNLKVVLISLVVLGALLTVVLAVCAVVACSKKRPRQPKRSIVACIQNMPSLHQGAIPKQRQDRRALINERGDSGDTSSVQNASLPYMPSKRTSASSKKCVISDPPAHAPPPPPAPAVMIPRARLHPHERESFMRRSAELSEAKLISYLQSGASGGNEEMRRKHSLESSYSANKERHCKQGALVSAGYKVSTTIRPDEATMKDSRDDLSSVNKADLEDMGRFDSLRKSYSQEDLSEWTDGERRMGELTLSEARSVGGTLPASTGRAASSTRLTHQEANTMAERDLGSTFLLPHVHLYRPDLTSDVSEFDSL